MGCQYSKYFGAEPMALALPPALGSDVFYPAMDLTPSCQAAKHKPGAANHEVFGRN